MERTEVMETIRRQTSGILQRNREVIRALTDGDEVNLKDFPLSDYIQDGEEHQQETRDDIEAEIDAIRADKSHPYNDPKASREEHQEAVEYVNSLIEKTRDNIHRRENPSKAGV